jgi:hypothetical protein
MNVSIHDLPAHTVETYEATPRARGISLDAFLREYLIRNAPSSPPAQMSPDEWEEALDDCFDSFPAPVPYQMKASAVKASTQLASSKFRSESNPIPKAGVSRLH